MTPIFKKQDFPEDQQPIYDFFLDEDGKICMNMHTRYARTYTPEYVRTKFTYRIHTDTRIITKTSAQMDRYLNGHLFTLDPDMKRAKAIITEYYRERLALARITTRQCEEALAELERQD